MSWYKQKKKELKAIAGAHGVKLSMVCGVVAAISPRIRWELAVSSAERLLSDPSYKLPCFPVCASQALRILGGEKPLSVLKGPKVRSFYQALMGDPEAVCVDSHVFNAWRGVLVPVKDTGKLTERDRAAVVKWVRMRARRAGVSPAAMQARIWLKQRERVRCALGR